MRAQQHDHALAFEYARSLGKVIVEHCEDHDLSHGAIMHEGKVSAALGINGYQAPPKKSSSRATFASANWPARASTSRIFPPKAPCAGPRRQAKGVV